MLLVRSPKSLWQSWTEPTVDGDFARRREAVLLNILATFVVFGILAQLDQVEAEIFGPRNRQFWLWWPVLFATTLGFYGLLRLARAGQHRASTIVLLLILSALSTALLVDNGASDSVWPLLTAVSVLLAALLLGGRSAVLVATWLAALTVICAGLEQAGWVIPLQPVDPITVGGSLAPVLL